VPSIQAVILNIRSPYINGRTSCNQLPIMTPSTRRHPRTSSPFLRLDHDNLLLFPLVSHVPYPTFTSAQGLGRRDRAHRNVESLEHVRNCVLSDGCHDPPLISAVCPLGPVSTFSPRGSSTYEVFFISLKYTSPLLNSILSSSAQPEHKGRPPTLPRHPD